MSFLKVKGQRSKSAAFITFPSHLPVSFAFRQFLSLQIDALRLGCLAAYGCQQLPANPCRPLRRVRMILPFFSGTYTLGKEMLRIVTRVPASRQAAWPPKCHLFGGPAIAEGAWKSTRVQQT